MPSRLAVLMVVDVVDYTRLMAEDETSAINAIQFLKDIYLEPKALEKGGEILKRMGDGWVIAFTSVPATVQCAIEVQNGLVGHPVIKLRIGAHIGEIVEDGTDFYGSGVNLAARLQTEAPPGGLMVSGDFHRQLTGELAHAFHDAGAFKLKNIAQPVSAFRWRPQETNGTARSDAPAADHLGHRGYSTEPTLETRSGAPQFLAYMVDRDIQRAQIRDTIPDPLSARPDRAIAYLTYGPENELHKSIAERYVNYTLPRHVRRPGDNLAAYRKYVNWPTTSLDETARFESLLRDILSEFSLKYTGRIDDVTAHFKEQFEHFLIAYRKSSTICINIRPEEWDDRSDFVFARVLEAFGRIVVPNGCLLTLFFQVKLRPAKSRLFNVFASKQPRAIASFLARFQSGSMVEASDKQGDAVNIVCLPELQSVTKADVERWATVTAPSVCTSIDPEALKEEATRQFSSAAAMPYESIIQNLRNALTGAIK